MHFIGFSVFAELWGELWGELWSLIWGTSFRLVLACFGLFGLFLRTLFLMYSSKKTLARMSPYTALEGQVPQGAGASRGRCPRGRRLMRPSKGSLL